MAPEFDDEGFLPPGIHEVTWEDFVTRFGGIGRRDWLLAGMRKALHQLKASGCKRVFIDGSFVTSKQEPDDFDGCWDARGVDGNILDRVFLDFTDLRKRQKLKYRGEFFISNSCEGITGKSFLDFFQMRKDSISKKGIVSIDLGDFR